MIILLGSSGFVGSEFKRQLVGWDVKCPSRDELMAFDFTSATCVINCVGTCKNCKERPIETYVANVDFPILLATNLTCKFIHIGTIVRGDFWYGITKAFTDEAIKRMNKNYTIYRFPWLEGNDFCQYVKDCHSKGETAKIYSEMGYPSTKEKCVKYVIDNMSNHPNEIVSLGGKPRTKSGWATDMFPGLKYESEARAHEYSCLKPDVEV
jgi:dTDP-4-dehydrorhamnose reductase